MEKVSQQEKGYAEDYTQDSSVDLKGRPLLRSKTGRWPACYFIVGYEVFERMAFYGIAANLVTYLTKKLHEGTVTSANNVTNWAGTVWMTPILGAYVADAHLGRYRTFVIASSVYLIGMCLLTLAVSVPSLRPPTCGDAINDADCSERASPFQVGIFYAALYVIAIGTGGTKPNISTMGADQFDEFEPNERIQKMSFFNWWMFSIFFGTLFANTFLIYIQENVGYTLGYGLPAVGLAVSVAVFLVGTPLYRHKLPSGSPVTRMARVVVAAVGKRNVDVPEDPKLLYELSLEEYTNKAKFMIGHTSGLRFLDKAAVNTGTTSPWTLCPITQVEETKQMIKMLPILLSTFIPSTTVAQVGTLFVKQGATLDRSLGPHFDLPPACLSAFVTLSMLSSLLLYDRLLVPALRRRTRNPRGLTLLQRMAVGLIIHVAIMFLAALVERHRLRVVAADGGIVAENGTFPLTVFVLMPQFALMGVADTFLEVAKLEFFYDQAPAGMKSVGTSYFTSSLGVGNFLSSVILRTVSENTRWVVDDLNVSRLDRYYLFLAGLSVVNLVFFLVVAKFFVYNVDEVEANKECEMVDESPKKGSLQVLQT